MDFMQWALPVFSIIILFGSIFGFYLGAKRRKMDMREYLNVFFIESFDLFIFVFLIASYLAEAIVATVLHPHDEQLISPAARWITHNSMSLLGFICSIASAKMISSFFQAIPFFFPKTTVVNGVTEVRKRAVYFPLLLLAGACITTYLAINVPYWNTSIIAKGLNQTRQFNYAFSLLMHPFTDKGVVASWYPGIDPSKDVVELLSYNMTASYFLMLAHIIGSILKGIFAAIDMFVVGSEGYVEKFQKSKTRQDLNEKINNRAANKGNGKPNDTANTNNGNNKPNEDNKENDSVTICLRQMVDPSSGEKIFTSEQDIAKMRKKITDKLESMGHERMTSTFREFNTAKDQFIKAGKNSDEALKASTYKTISYQLKTLIESDDASNGLDLTLEV